MNEFQIGDVVHSVKGRYGTVQKVEWPGLVTVMWRNNRFFVYHPSELKKVNGIELAITRL